MAGLFTVPASPGNDLSKGSQYPALITAIAVRATTEDASQWQDLGPLANAELHIKGGQFMAQGKRPIQVQGYEVEWKAEVTSVTTATRAALDKINEYGTDTRITTVDGSVYTFLYTDNCDSAFTEDLTGQDINTPRKFMVTGGGSISKAVYTTCFTAAA